ncbi:MAG TPA: FAD-dependent monooxygenase [Burkholderiales bacterium]|nr:FAD-dependent monooxygenase [Burkholderiales bacterium]
MHDIIIIGGGPVGSVLAAALGGSGLAIMLLEARVEAAGDRRSLALSYGSRLILERVGAWDALTPMTPIESIHVSQRGGFGRALLTATAARVPALGYVAAYGTVYQATARAAARCATLLVQQGARATALTADERLATVSYVANGATASASARLVVVADGGALTMSAAPQERPYGQTALVADVRTDRAHGNRAFERFTAEGPLALLPAGEGFALIWTAAPERAQRLQALDAPAFLDALQACFGDRAGRFVSVSERATHPLTLRVANAAGTGRAVLLGNAAQTLHPVAGQGLNLGLRDAWVLARAAASAPQRIGEPDFIARFLSSRAADRRDTLFLTDLLVTTFSNDLAPLRWLRGCGLTLLDCLPPAKRDLMDRMIFGA